MYPNGGRLFIQACLNGGRTRDYRPKVPVSAGGAGDPTVTSARFAAAVV